MNMSISIFDFFGQHYLYLHYDLIIIPLVIINAHKLNCKHHTIIIMNKFISININEIRGSVTWLRVT